MEEIIIKGDLDTVIEELKRVAPQDYRSRFWHKKRGVRTDGSFKLVVGDEDKQKGSEPTLKGEKDKEPREDKPKEPKEDKPKEPKEDKPKEPKEDKPKEPKEDKPKEPKEDKPKEPKEKTEKEEDKPPKSEICRSESTSEDSDSDKDGETDSKGDDGDGNDGNDEEDDDEYEDVDEDWGKESFVEGNLPGMGQYSKGEESDGSPEDIYRPRDKRTLNMDSNYFARRLKAVLKDNAVHRPSRNKIYGDLSHKSIYKIATTSKIFERKQLDGKKDYYIGLIVDCSGSMDGDKCDMAAFSAKTLIKEFQAVTKICVTTFNRRNKLIKKFDEKFDEKRLERVSWDIHRDTRSSDASDNYDVDALRFMFEQMKSIRMGRKAMIIISDGRPQYRNDDDGNTFRETVKRIEKSGIPVLSIGLCHAGVDQFYTTYDIVNSVPSLYDSIIKMIQKYVIRSSGV